MKDEIFSNISKIIERDSKFSTYKFALLRGTIDVIHDNSPFIKFSNHEVIIPLGLLIEKWLLYYYPILDSEIYFPQINGNKKLAFESYFLKVISNYHLKGGLSVFYNDLRRKGIPESNKKDVLLLLEKIANTIIKQPMNYIGGSLGKSNSSIFTFNNDKKRIKIEKIDLEYLIERFGNYSIPFSYYSAFQLFGTFISGRDSLINKWVEFSIKASGNEMEKGRFFTEILKDPVTARDSQISKNIYNEALIKHGKVKCVWTGQNLGRFEVDHIIPFSVWKNNDLWNLLPSSSKVNREKLDKIPSPEIVESSKTQILEYWQIIKSEFPGRFEKELKLSILGRDLNSDWPFEAINKLKETCNFLINTRGFQEWRPKC